MKQRLAQPAHLVSLASIPGLDYIREEEGQIRIGALTTMRSVETSPLVQERASLVADTSSGVSPPVRIRNMATIGGGLAHGDPSQDPPPTLIALGSSVVLRSSVAERTVPLADFFLDYYETDVQPGEVLTELRIPLPAANARGAFIKFLPRTADDYATVSVAAVLEMGRRKRLPSSPCGVGLGRDHSCGCHLHPERPQWQRAGRWLGCQRC